MTFLLLLFAPDGALEHLPRVPVARTVVNTREGASRTFDGRFKTFYLRFCFEMIGENIVILKIKKNYF